MNHRDGKSGYLKDIQRTMVYVHHVSSRYPAQESFAGLMRRLRVAEYKPA
jgi:aminoglycoside/choline kinase family phosphotransferase